MSIAMSQGFGPLGERPALKRLASLKLRTLLVAALALAALAASAFLLVPPLQSISSAMYALFTPGDGGQALHLPPELLHNALYERLQAVLMFMILMAVAGLSAGAFGRTRAALVAVVPLLLAGLTLWNLPPTSRWMHVVPSQLERRIAQADWRAVRPLVEATQEPQLVKDYVLAQIALREHDKVRLAAHAEPVLAWTERYVYGLPMSAADLAVQPYAVNFEPEVLWALDVGLHQQAETEIGIGWQTTPAPDKSMQSALQTLMRGLQLALGAALLAGACALVRLWNSMRRRVARIHLELHPAADAFTEL